MKRALAAVCGATLLIISAHRLPAPIVEPEEKATPAAGGKRKEPPPKKQSTGSSVSDSARRFDGTWVFAPKPGIRFTLVIRNANSAQWTAEVTNTLPANKKSWPFLPAQYARVQ